MTATTCTIQYADGSLCAKPSVDSFVSANDGKTYYECADHKFIQPLRSPAVSVGSRVLIRVHGLDKVGVVAKVGRTLAYVDVDTYGGKNTRRVSYPLADLIVLSSPATTIGGQLK